MLMGSILNIYNSNLLVHCSGNIFFRELIEHSVYHNNMSMSNRNKYDLCIIQH